MRGTSGAASDTAPNPLFTNDCGMLGGSRTKAGPDEREKTHMKSKGSMPGKQASRVTRLAAAGAATALVGAGIGIVGAGSAQASSNPEQRSNHERSKPGGVFKKNAVPKKVIAGTEFKYKCKVISGWAGLEIKIKEKNVPVHAKRKISSNGSCKMRVVLLDKGKHKLRMKIINPENGGNQFSNTLKINVK